MNEALYYYFYTVLSSLKVGLIIFSFVLVSMIAMYHAIIEERFKETTKWSIGILLSITILVNVLVPSKADMKILAGSYFAIEAIKSDTGQEILAEGKETLSSSKDLLDGLIKLGTSKVSQMNKELENE